MFKRYLGILCLCSTLAACGAITATGVVKTVGAAASIGAQIAGIFSDAANGGNWEADLTNLMATAPGEVTSALSSLATKPASSPANSGTSSLKYERPSGTDSAHGRYVFASAEASTGEQPKEADNAAAQSADLGTLIKVRADACRAKVGKDCLSHEMASLFLHNRVKYVGDVELTKTGAAYVPKNKNAAAKGASK